MKTEKLDLLINTAFMSDITNYFYSLTVGERFIQVAIPDISKPIMFNNLDLVIGQKQYCDSWVGSRKEVLYYKKS